MAEMETMATPPITGKKATPPVELAGPKAPAKRLSFFAALRAMNENPLATIPMAAYEQPIWQARSMFGDQLLVSDPAGIKRVLLDNVANYAKAALDVRILSAAFGDGLLTSDGDKWRAHRRVMSPSFDHRSIASYAPVITAAAEAVGRSRSLRSGTVFPGEKREAAAFRLSAVRRRSARLHWRAACADGSLASHRHHGAALPAETRAGTGHRPRASRHAASPRRHPHAAGAQK